MFILFPSIQGWNILNPSSLELTKRGSFVYREKLILLKSLLAAQMV